MCSCNCFLWFSLVQAFCSSWSKGNIGQVFCGCSGSGEKTSPMIYWRAHTQSWLLVKKTELVYIICFFFFETNNFKNNFFKKRLTDKGERSIVVTDGAKRSSLIIKREKNHSSFFLSLAWRIIGLRHLL